MTLKKWESARQYAGADFQVGGTWYKVFPLYTPGTFQAPVSARQATCPEQARRRRTN